MRKIILAGVAAVAVAGMGAAAVAASAGAAPSFDPGLLVLAQNAAPPAPGAGTPPPPPGPPGMPPRPGPMAEPAPMAERGPGGPGWMHRPMWHHAAMFGLFFHPADRQLTPADVQKIAEAFLLWNGNRTWKVTEVAAGPDGKIGFAFATADGGVIARFTMDSHDGRIARVG